jgi:hypothetical protein
MPLLAASRGGRSVSGTVTPDLDGELALRRT